MTKTARVYKIEMLIRNRGHVSFKDMLDELEVSPATLKRDIEYLRDQLGAPIEYDRYLNGYRFGQEFRGEKHELPGLWFNERELYSLLMAHQLLSELDSDGAISRHLQPLLDRIHQMLGTGEAEAKALLKRVKIISSAKRPVPSQFFELVARGAAQAQAAAHEVPDARARRGQRARGVAAAAGALPQHLVPGRVVPHGARGCCGLRSTPSRRRRLLETQGQGCRAEAGRGRDGRRVRHLRRAQASVGDARVRARRPRSGSVGRSGTPSSSPSGWPMASMS